MTIALLVIGATLLAIVLAAAFKTILALDFPRFIKPIQAGGRDAYFVIAAFGGGCIVLSLLSAGRLTSFEVAGIKGQVDRIDQKVVSLQEQVVDLGKREWRAEKITTTGKGGMTVSLHETGCPKRPLDGSKVAYCVEGTPPSVFQVLATGEKRPVSSFSPVGFQDISTGPKPRCNKGTRGTLFVEKRKGGGSDMPFLCVKGPGNSYAWAQLVVDASK